MISTEEYVEITSTVIITNEVLVVGMTIEYYHYYLWKLFLIENEEQIQTLKEHYIPKGHIRITKTIKIPMQHIELIL